VLKNEAATLPLLGRQRADTNRENVYYSLRVSPGANVWASDHDL
jgi:hypothetical protein